MNPDALFVPYVPLFVQLDGALSSLQVQSMKAVEHEDEEFNNDYSVDPLADPRLDKMDLFNMVDTKDRDQIMNAQSSYNSGEADLFSGVPASEDNSAPVSGSGE